MIGSALPHDAVLRMLRSRFANNGSLITRLGDRSVPHFNCRPHTANRDGQPEPWGLLADRANSVRQTPEEQGCSTSNIYKVAGSDDTDPLFADDPDAAPNRRITVALINEAPSLPPGLAP